VASVGAGGNDGDRQLHVMLGGVVDLAIVAIGSVSENQPSFAIAGWSLLGHSRFVAINLLSIVV